MYSIQKSIVNDGRTAITKDFKFRSKLNFQQDESALFDS